jgi:hypothetical protein
MRRLVGKRDPIKEFLESIAARPYCLQPIPVKCGLSARARPGLSERTRSRDARRVGSVYGMY